MASVDHDISIEIDDESPSTPPAKAPPSRIVEALREAGRQIMRFIGLILAIAFAIIVGIVTSRMTISSGTSLTTDRFGPWHYWREAGKADADPYTRAHIMRSGAVTLSVDIAGVFTADTDGDGARLHSSCDYVIETPTTNGLWWSIAVFDSAGAVVANDANRFAFTRDTAAANPDGSYIMTLGRDARPGNWLPTGGAGRLVLVYTLLDPATGLSPSARSTRQTFLPEIRSEGCS